MTASFPKNTSRGDRGLLRSTHSRSPSREMLGDVVQVVAAQKHIAAISTGAISSRIWGTAPIACKASVPFQGTIAAMATISKAPMPQLNR